MWYLVWLEFVCVGGGGGGVEGGGGGHYYCSWDQVENTVEISSQPVESKLRSEFK